MPHGTSTLRSLVIYPVIDAAAGSCGTMKESSRGCWSGVVLASKHMLRGLILLLLSSYVCLTLSVVSRRPFLFCLVLSAARGVASLAPLVCHVRS